MNLHFRKAEISDISLIAELAERIWKKHYTKIISMEQIMYMLGKMYSAENLRQQMTDGHVFSLVYAGEVPVGYVSISSKDQKNFFLHKFYIETADHGKGYGSAFFDHLVDQLKGAETIELTVNRQNFKAINFYFKKGFIIKDVADFDIGNGYFMNDFIMINRLSRG